jgi:hypothetical protein
MPDGPLDHFVIKIAVSSYEIIRFLFNVGATHNHFEINDSFLSIDIFVPQQLSSLVKTQNLIIR